ERISDIGKVGGFNVINVAKALFLLQQIEEWIPATSTNIAAALYPSLGTSSVDHLSNIESCLEELKKRKWVREEGGIYRFLSEMERNFEDEVDQQSKSILSLDILSKALDMSKTIFRSMRNYNHRNLRVFDVTIFVDDESLYKGGPHSLRIFTPLFNAGDKDRIDDLTYRSMGETKTVFWISSDDDVFASRIRRALALRKTLDEWTRTIKTPQELQELDSSRKELAGIEDELPRTLSSVLRNGIVVFGGKKHDLDPKDDVSDIVGKWMNEFTQQEYTRFDEASVRIKDKDIEAALRWRGGKAQTLLKELRLVDTQGKPLLTGPIAHELMQELKKTNVMTEGSVLTTRFAEPPFGWDERAIRLVMAFLYRQSSIQVEPERDSVFIKSSEFKKARFSAGTVLSSEEISKAKENLSKIFGVTAGVTPEEISQKMFTELGKMTDSITFFRTLDGFHQLPYETELKTLISTIEKIRDVQSASLRIRAFIEDAIIQEISSGKDFLIELKKFVDKGHLDVLQSLKTNVSKMGRDLGLQYPQLGSQIVSLKEKVEGNVVEDWASIYDAYVKLLGDYEKRYVEQHKRTQESIDILHRNVSNWIEENKVESKTKSFAEERIARVSCKKGGKGDFNQDLLMCKTCNRSLDSLKAHEAKAHQLETEIISMMLETIAEQGKDLFDVILEHEVHIKTKEDMQTFLRKVSDFVAFWIAKGKHVHIDLEGKSVDEK
ncbi:MAG: hypothetical protein ACFFER_16105, partial [Candidatus Thorarchaeota archaeon]